MKTNDLQSAITEALRFVKRAEELIGKRCVAESSAVLQKIALGSTEFDFPREQGAVKRASLDLSRSLSHMRRRGQ